MEDKDEGLCVHFCIDIDGMAWHDLFVGMGLVDAQRGSQRGGALSRVSEAR